MLSASRHINHRISLIILLICFYWWTKRHCYGRWTAGCSRQYGAPNHGAVGGNEIKTRSLLHPNFSQTIIAALTAEIINFESYSQRNTHLFTNLILRVCHVTKLKSWIPQCNCTPCLFESCFFFTSSPKRVPYILVTLTFKYWNCRHSCFC